MLSLRSGRRSTGLMTAISAVSLVLLLAGCSEKPAEQPSATPPSGNAAGVDPGQKPIGTPVGHPGMAGFPKN